MSRVRWITLWAMGVVAGFIAVEAAAQGNIDAGKTPAQIFTDTCSGCHRTARELKRPSAGFMREHYTASREEAAAMAAYLAGIPSDPRAVQQRRTRTSTPRQTPLPEPASRPRRPPASERAKSSEGQSPASASARQGTQSTTTAANTSAASTDSRPATAPPPQLAPHLYMEE